MPSTIFAFLCLCPGEAPTIFTGPIPLLEIPTTQPLTRVWKSAPVVLESSDSNEEIVVFFGCTSTAEEGLGLGNCQLFWCHDDCLGIDDCDVNDVGDGGTTIGWTLIGPGPLVDGFDQCQSKEPPENCGTFLGDTCNPDGIEGCFSINDTLDFIGFCEL